MHALRKTVGITYSNMTFVTSFVKIGRFLKLLGWGAEVYRQREVVIHS
jgi:hypothetical protein